MNSKKNVDVGGVSYYGLSALSQALFRSNHATNPKLFTKHSIVNFTVLIDTFATFECLCVSYFLLTCSGTKYFDWVGWGIGLLGCGFSLLSSIGGLGSITNNLISIGNWYFGVIGFFVATLPRSYVQSVLRQFWGWMKTQLGYVEAAEYREEIAL